MRRLLFVLGVLLLLPACERQFQQNPDPNHTHADFLVWIQGEVIDFSDPKYMSGVSYDEESHDEEEEYHHEHLHLHDDVGHVVHRHKPGLTIGEFFTSIGFTLDNDCFTLDTGKRLCTDSASEWHMYVGNPIDDQWTRLVPMDPDYVFNDMDQILLMYDPSQEDIDLHMEQMTEDSCLYSRTCPWRGDPPDENCVADPAVPCVEL